MGLVATLIVLWLSISFWYEAWSLGKDAKQLNHLITFEDKLLELSEGVSKKRTSFHLIDENTIWGGDSNFAVDTQELSDVSEQTFLDSFISIKQLLYDLHNLSSKSSNDANIPAGLNEIIEALQIRFSQVENGQDSALLSTKGIEGGSGISDDTDNPIRAYFVKFDSYTSLAEGLHSFYSYTRSTYPLRKNNSNIDAARSLRFNALNMIELSDQIDTLVKQYIKYFGHLEAEEIASSDEVEFVLLIERIKGLARTMEVDSKNLSIGRNFDQLDSDLAGNSIELQKWFQSEYLPLVSNIITGKMISNGPAFSQTDWSTVTQITNAKIDALWLGTKEYISKEAKSVQNLANRNLFIDTALVALSLIIGFLLTRRVKAIKHLSQTDQLTLLPNRSNYLWTLDTLCHQASKDGTSLHLVHMDTKRFREISDTLGQGAGSLLLKHIGERLKKIQSNNIFVAYQGSDKFSLILKGNDDQEARKHVRSIHRKMQKEFLLEGRSYNLDWCIGVSQYPDHAGSIEELELAADFALLHSRMGNSADKGISVYNDDLSTLLQNRLRITSDIPNAISQNQFVLQYQPQFDTNLQKATRVEALIRWQHPQLGFIPPYNFLTIAEQSGYMPAIGDWVINEAVRRAAEWNTGTSDPIAVAVNVSADHFSRKDFVPSILQALTTYRLDPCCLEIEITESMVIDDMEQITSVLHELQTIGINISLDDFGTGYSSLSQLHSLPIDILKIDQFFISQLNQDKNPSNDIVSTIVRVARSYNLEIVAEGVELEEQISVLRNLEVDYLQGYFYSKPVFGEEVPELLEKLNSCRGPDCNAA